MNWKEFLKPDWRKIFLSGGLSILFLTVNKTTIEMFQIIFFYFISIAILIYSLMWIHGGAYVYLGSTLKSQLLNFSKKFIAFVSLLVTSIFFYFTYHDKFIPMFILYWLVSFLISCLIIQILDPKLQKISNILINTKLSKKVWITMIIITILLLVTFSVIFASFGG